MEQLLVEMNKLGIKLRLDGNDLRLSAPQGVLTDALRQAVRQHKEQLIELLRSHQEQESALPVLVADPAKRHEPFPLTELQHAYWVGRRPGVEMGNVATHLYVELDCSGMDLERLNCALCRLIERHDMLRAVIDSDGLQRVLPSVPDYHIAIDDQSQSGPDQVDKALAAVRQTMLDQVRPTDQWPLFDIRATRLPQAGLRLQISLDLLLLDASSIFYFFREWHQLYVQPDQAWPAIELSFRDCVLAEHALQEGAAYRAAHAYWMDRIDTLPAAPELPLRADPAARLAPRFSRREARLEKSRWDQLKAGARALGVTPPNLLLAVYGEVLARWSATPHFTVNVTVSNRPALHPDVDRLLGDFTSLIMHEVDRRDSGLSFLEFARNLQRRFMTDLTRRQVSGVNVLREWAKRRGMGLGATMPVVFSCGLIGSGDQEVGNIEQFGRKVFSVSQTSQVWLHLFVVEQNGDLVISWDAVDAVFEPGVLDAMFNAYCKLLECLEGDSAVWDSSRVTALPAAMQERREDANNTAAALPVGAIHAGFVRHALSTPQATALIAPEVTLSYGQLLSASVALADRLRYAGATDAQPVAIVMRKGWEQIVAVYGVLLAGCAYLPIDADLPPQRQLDLLRLGEVAHVVTQPAAARSELNTDEWKIHLVQSDDTGTSYGPVHACTLENAADRLAYVIFTSGTTGVPKGVMIDHGSALNTLHHINALVGASPTDRLLGLSSLSFDLSVYDIFGLHDAGGTLVLPDHRKGHDPVHWHELLLQHQVTLWNSAPQLMQMLMDGLPAGASTFSPLRVVMLSGDFIPLDLPDRIRTRASAAQVISLGGATEASIWSNYYRVQRVDPAWSSIPYGKPLPNQTMWVYDRAFQPCPDHVIGRIFIGGAGLARGYLRDAEKTAARFVRHPLTGERLYDTGDLGCYAADGNIMIIGRDDGQIKLRGHRVELGEIEAVLCRHPSVRQAVVMLGAGLAERRQLLAFLELDPATTGTQEQTEVTLASVLEFLAQRLPDYMVPRQLLPLERIPLSVNGKVDHAALAVLSAEYSAQADGPVAPRTALEHTILQAWSRVIADCQIGVTDNFFELGGDSVLATLLVRELNAALPVAIEMHELFENLTIESLAALYQSRFSDEAGQGIAVLGQPAGSASAPVLEDVSAAVKQLAALKFDQTPGATPAVPRAILVTGATGWVGAHLLPELLARTDATIHCLVRAASPAEGMQRLLENLQRCGIRLESAWTDRIEAVCGDLAHPDCGLNADQWQTLAAGVDAIYHLGGTVSVLADYATHSKVNVASTITMVRLALAHHVKPLYVLSPMTVCRRHLDDGLHVHTAESAQPDPDGLLTAYAQSKWALEQVLLAAANLGMPLRIYRTSHALPSSRTGLMKPHDTYGSVLRVACAVGLVPEWPDSALHGVPVDTLVALMVENSLDGDDYRGIIHLDNRHPASLQSVIESLLEALPGAQDHPERVPLAVWKTQCLQAVHALPQADASLVQLLFSERQSGTPIEHMFSPHSLETAYFERRGQGAQLADLTPSAYWRALAARPGWSGAD
jgi:amino acid adenylation domain-containing protein/thioester reductase-like protein